MIPIRDTIRARRWPVVNYALIALCAWAYWLELAAGPDLDALVRRATRSTPATFVKSVARHGAFELAQWTPFVTSMFLHGGIAAPRGQHVVPLDLRRQRGGSLRSRGLRAVLSGGRHRGGAARTCWRTPARRCPTVGASGAIAAVMGAYMLLYPGARIESLVIVFIFVRVISVPAFVWLGLWFVFQVLSGSADSRGSGEGGVAPGSRTSAASRSAPRWCSCSACAASARCARCSVRARSAARGRLDARRGRRRRAADPNDPARSTRRTATPTRRVLQPVAAHGLLVLALPALAALAQPVRQERGARRARRGERRRVARARRSTAAELTWVGHATFAIHDGADVVLTDPHFGSRARSCRGGTAARDSARVRSGRRVRGGLAQSLRPPRRRHRRASCPPRSAGTCRSGSASSSASAGAAT